MCDYIAEPDEDENKFKEDTKSALSKIQTKYKSMSKVNKSMEKMLKEICKKQMIEIKKEDSD